MDLAKLAKAFILDTGSRDRIPVLYNPEQYTLEHGNAFAEVGIPGLATPPIQYVRGKARTLSMDLFFDTYEQQQDVRAYTGRVTALLAPTIRSRAPPILIFTMGPFSFRCVLLEANQRFTLFARDGTPVRAIVSVRFQEYEEVKVEAESGLFIGPPTLHNIAQGETVSAVASAVLGDPARWREVADANGVEDPFRLEPGRTLVVPGSGR